MDVRRNRIGIYFKNRNGDEQATKSAVRFAIPLLIDNTVDQDFVSNEQVIPYTGKVHATHTNQDNVLNLQQSRWSKRMEGILTATIQE